VAAIAFEAAPILEQSGDADSKQRIDRTGVEELTFNVSKIDHAVYKGSAFVSLYMDQRDQFQSAVKLILKLALVADGFRATGGHLPAQSW
jgi:hypothetical protein